MITKDQIKQVMPKITAENLEKFYEPLNAALEKWEINTPRRIAMFLAQLAHESGSFRYVKELASGEAYEGRKDLGNIEVGDGVKYKGRGLIQITGRRNYADYFTSVGLPVTSDPTLLEGALHAVNSAGWFWKTRKLNIIAESPDITVYKHKDKVYGPFGPFEYITLRINGGFNGMDDRLKYYANAKKAFGL